MVYEKLEKVLEGARLVKAMEASLAAMAGEKYEDLAAEKARKQLEGKLAAGLRRLLTAREEAFLLIERLESLEERTVMFERYVNGKTFEDIAGDNAMGVSTVYRMQKRGVAALEKLEKERVKAVRARRAKAKARAAFAAGEGARVEGGGVEKQ